MKIKPFVKLSDLKGLDLIKGEDQNNIITLVQSGSKKFKKIFILFLFCKSFKSFTCSRKRKTSDLAEFQIDSKKLRSDGLEIEKHLKLKVY
jgi:hypothetical protein